MKILIVKLGAMGDVLRTTPLLTALKKRHSDAHITWLVDPACAAVLENNHLIDRLVAYSDKNLSELAKDKFDLAINLDKDKEALDSIMAVSAQKKMGFGRDGKGQLTALDALSDYAYRLGIDDDLKFRKNKKTYQEISFEQVGLRFNGEEYIFSADEESVSFSRQVLKKLGMDVENKDKLIVGLNTGSGHRFAGKKLPIQTYVELIEKYTTQMNAVVLLLGGKDEIERNKTIQKASRLPVVNTGSHSIKQFAAIVKECDVVISGDTIAMHVAIAVKTPVVAHFASTCAAEIELYGRGKRVISDIKCAPCYLKTCPIDEQCMKDMNAEMIFEASKEVLNEAAGKRVCR